MKTKKFILHAYFCYSLQSNLSGFGFENPTENCIMTDERCQK